MKIITSFGTFENVIFKMDTKGYNTDYEYIKPKTHIRYILDGKIIETSFDTDTILEIKEDINIKEVKEAVLWYTNKTTEVIVKSYKEYLKLKEQQNNCKHERIEYCSTYEMRDNDMYCLDCKKYGSRDELQG